MINHEKNEKDYNINNIIVNFPSNLNDLINYAKWELTLISSLKTDNNYKQNLILIDKEWLSQWKEISGYKYIKNQIFKYLSNTQKNKNNDDNLIEETKKLNDSWLCIKDKYTINSDKLQKMKPMNNKQFLINHNNKTIINGTKRFYVISNDIHEIFKKYLEKNFIIKAGGLFKKKKLLIPFNYNDKNRNYIFIDMLFINNSKDEIEEILFVFPNLNLNIIEKIRKEIESKDVNEFIKDINNNVEKEFYFIDNNRNKYTYKAIYKNILLFNKNNQNKIISNGQNIFFEEEEINGMKQMDINSLTIEELEKKIRVIEEKTNKLIEIKKDLNSKENSYLNELNAFEKEKKSFYEDKSNCLNINSFNSVTIGKNLEKEYNECSENLKKIEFKNQHTLDEIQVCKEKEKIFNNEYKKYKKDYQNKINELNNKINDINNKENQIKIKDDKLINDLYKKKLEVKNKEQELDL